jgi:hypothetical protein
MKKRSIEAGEPVCKSAGELLQQSQHAIASLRDDVVDRWVSQYWERFAVMNGFEGLATKLADSFSNHRPTEF